MRETERTMGHFEGSNRIKEQLMNIVDNNAGIERIFLINRLPGIDINKVTTALDELVRDNQLFQTKTFSYRRWRKTDSIRGKDGIKPKPREQKPIQKYEESMDLRPLISQVEAALKRGFSNGTFFAGKKYSVNYIKQNLTCLNGYDAEIGLKVLQSMPEQFEFLPESGPKRGGKLTRSVIVL